MLSRNIVKYFLVGGLCFLIDFSLFALLVTVFEFNYLLVNMFSFSLAAAANYFLCIKFVFYSGHKYDQKTEFLLLFTVSLVVLAVNQLILYCLITGLSYDILLSKIFAVIVTFLMNYFGRKIFVFSNRLR